VPFLWLLLVNNQASGKSGLKRCIWPCTLCMVEIAAPQQQLAVRR
jgi:hypothetical protein